MKILDADKLYKCYIKILDTNDIVPAVVYKKNDCYFDMRYVNSTLDLNKFAGVYYTKEAARSKINGLVECILLNSLERFYKDRESFKIDELHKDMHDAGIYYLEDYTRSNNITR